MGRGWWYVWVGYVVGMGVGRCGWCMLWVGVGGMCGWG